MKKSGKVMVVIGVVFFLCLLPVAGKSGEKPIVLKAGSAWPQTHDGNTMFYKFFDMVAKKSNGSVKVKWMGGPELIKGRDLPTASNAGSIDIFQSSPGYYGGIVGEGAVVDAFPVYRNFDTAPKIFEEMLKIITPIYEKKMKIRPLSWTWSDIFYLWTKKPVHNFDEMKGLKIRAHGGLVPHIARALGLTPVTMPSTDVYMALERGVIDGAIRNKSSVINFKEYEFARFGISTPVTWGTAITYISSRKWSKLDEAQKNAIMAAARESTKAAAKFWREKNSEYQSQFKSLRIEFFDLPPEIKSKWVRLAADGGRKAALKLSPDHGDEIIAIFKKYGTKE